MDMNLGDYAQNYNGEVLIEVVGCKQRDARTGSVGIQADLLVKEVTSNYDTDQYQDPSGEKLQDTVWYPMAGDPESKKKNKGVSLYKFVSAFGFDPDDGMPEYEDFMGLEAICRVGKDKEGKLEIKYQSYKRA